MKTENPLASDQPLTIEQVFQQVDADNSGRIEFQELAEWWSAHQKQSRGSTDEQALMRCMDLFEQYDPKGKGLGEHEFRELMAELAHALPRRTRVVVPTFPRKRKGAFKF